MSESGDREDREKVTEKMTFAMDPGMKIRLVRKAEEFNTQPSKILRDLVAWHLAGYNPSGPSHQNDPTIFLGEVQSLLEKAATRLGITSEILFRRLVLDHLDKYLDDVRRDTERLDELRKKLEG